MLIIDHESNLFEIDSALNVAMTFAYSLELFYNRTKHCRLGRRRFLARIIKLTLTCFFLLDRNQSSLIRIEHLPYDSFWMKIIGIDH